ncbi:XdhC family protein [Arthrobacter cryoconiti]|uniref:XdhC family protein n=1 Tax=Arthrobacter cryoconiti TaxID=748907 RepID=A0ABV8QV95_9MICC|nr:XdhC/CoxI family protein [Arthrobacter cryoconiti]MCC9069658.1 XdhC family protein [Arthrobacter cryoconiti]
MREVLKDLLDAVEAGQTVGLGTVVRTLKSAPRPAGASMMVDAGGRAVGSVSGGCVEGALYELATSVARLGQPVLQRYGITENEAFDVGLTCGGIMDVFVEPVSAHTFPELAAVARNVQAGDPVAVVTVIEHPDPAWLGRHLVVRPDGFLGSLGSDRADHAVSDDTMGLLAAGRNTTLMYGPDGERRGEGMRVFVASFAPQPRMLVFGAIDFAAAVAQQGSFLGYRVTVCDARAVFATKARFPVADEVVVEWPHRYLQAQIDAGAIDARTVIAVLTHDPKFDVPLLEVALRHELAYVGAMGSRKTHVERMERLRQAGLSEDELARLSSPIGLDLGSRTPEETAVSIAAEIISQRWGGQGGRLRHMDVRIHHVPLADADHE